MFFFSVLFYIINGGIGNRVYESMETIRKSELFTKLNSFNQLNPESTVYTTGYGQSGMAAQYLTGCLRCLGIHSSYFTPEGFEHSECLKVKNRDILISFGSGGGLPKSDAWAKAIEYNIEGV